MCEQGRVSHGGEQSEAWPAHRPPFMNLKLMKLHKTSFTISSCASRERVKLNKRAVTKCLLKGLALKEGAGGFGRL